MNIHTHSEMESHKTPGHIKRRHRPWSFDLYTVQCPMNRITLFYKELKILKKIFRFYFCSQILILINSNWCLILFMHFLALDEGQQFKTLKTLLKTMKGCKKNVVNIYRNQRLKFAVIYFFYHRFTITWRHVTKYLFEST